MIATAPAEHYRQALEVLARHDVADAIVSIFIPPLATRSTEVAEAIRESVGASSARPQCSLCSCRRRKRHRR